MRTIRVGLIGLGTVGSGVVEILKRHREDFRSRAGVDIELARFADRTETRFTDLGLDPDACTTDAFALIDDPSLDVVIELIGGTGVARDVVLTALGTGKSVVTANKALMATSGEEVMEAAEANGVDIAFEASVGGGIPIIGPLKHSLTSNEITAVMGIVNGTTNYMLTRMADNGPHHQAACDREPHSGRHRHPRAPHHDPQRTPARQRERRVQRHLRRGRRGGRDHVLRRGRRFAACGKRRGG